MSCPETSGCYVVQGGGKKKKKRKNETETVRSLFLVGGVQVCRLKAAEVAATPAVEANSVLGGSNSQVGLKPP